MRRVTCWAGVVGVVMALVAASGVGAAAAASASSPPPAAGVAPAPVNVEGTGYVFFTAAGGTVEVKSLASGGSYTSLGGHLVGAPAALVTAAGHEGLAEFEIFGRGTDNALWYTTCTAEGPTQTDCDGSWTSLGGVLSSAPGAAGDLGGPVSVYGRGSDGAVWVRDQSGTSFGAWSRIGGALRPGTAPAAATTGNGNTWLLVVGTNRQLYVHEVGQTGFTAAGGTTGASPALVTTASALVAFVRGTDNALWYHQFLSSASGWSSLGGDLRSGVGAFGDTSGTDQLVADGLGTDEQIWQHTDLDSGSWSAVTP